jgi:hypothetical protein
MNIIPLPPAHTNGAAPPDVRPLAYAMARMDADLWAPLLPGESFEDALTRREAARDILADLLAEYAGEYAAAGAVA